ncbi:MAG: TatD family hydrolase, partial [Oscillospiraceae bacterium]
MIFDSHAHYDDEKFDDDRDELLLSLHQNGIDYITNVGCNLKTSFASLELAKKYSFIYATAGFHPEDILDLDDDAMLKIESLLRKEKVVAMGEIGLDYHYDSPTPEKQKEAFIKQLSLAKELDVPVIIHSRDAASDTFEIIKKFKPKGVVHCFS